MSEQIQVLGTRVHNLKDIDVTIPRNKLVVITGLSGSGKSSLAFDTIYAEGQRRYMETLSAENQLWHLTLFMQRVSGGTSNPSLHMPASSLAEWNGLTLIR